MCYQPLFPLSPSTNVYRSNILSSTPNVGHPFTTTNASSQATQIRRPRGRPRLNARALTNITNIRGSSQPPQVCPLNVLPTSQNVSPTTNVALATNHTNCSSQKTQVPRLRGRPCLSTQALTDITNIHGSAQPPQIFSPNVSSTTNVPPLTTETNGSSQATQVRRHRGRPPLSARPLSDITNIRGSAQPPQFCSPNVSSTKNVPPLTTQTNGSSQATQVRRRRGLPSQHDRMSSPINPTPPVMLSSVNVVDNQGNLRHLPQSSCVTNSANSMTNVIALNNSTPRHISELANTDQNGTNVPASVYRTQRQQRRMTQYANSRDATYTCAHCQAKYWYDERMVRRSSITNLRFLTCCSEGKVVLPLLFHPPPLLTQLMDYNGGERSKLFWKNLKLLNSMFSFTLTGANINREINDGRGPYAFQINGHNHHRIGTLLPTHTNGRPRFAQLYIYDTEHEVDNRLYALNITSPSGVVDNNLCSLVQDLITMLDMHNPLVQSFRMAKDRFVQSSIQPVTLRLIGTLQRTGCQYNLPTASQVAALIPGDGNPTESHDVIIEEPGNEENRNGVKRSSELHPSFMALQYLLLFPYGEDGFHLHIPLNSMRTKNSYYLNNSSVTIPRRRNKRRASNVVELELRTIVEIAPMTDNRTIEELLQAHTEGYGEAIAIPKINADHFEIKTNLLQLVQANPYHGFERENPHTHINNFKRITSTLKFKDVPNDVIKLMMFPYSIEGAARVCGFFQNQALTSGTLSSNTIPNPKGKIKEVTTRSGVAYEGPSISTNPKKVVERETEETADKEQTNFQVSTAHIQPPVVPIPEPDVLKTLTKQNIPYPSRLNDQKLREKAKNQMEKFFRKDLPKTTGRALIDVYGEEITLRVNDEVVTFNLNQTPRYSYTYDDMSVNRINVIDVAREEYAQEMLGFSKNSSGSNPTSTSEPIISDSSPSLTLFKGSDFILEEIEAYLKDEWFISKMREVAKAKSSIEEPPELELKDLPSHSEYAYLEGADKLPMIIAKDLKDDEKEALLKVLKSHKRAISWKITDIKGIDPRFCTYKILMEEDYKPAVQSQRRVNPKIHEVIKKEAIKLLDAVMIYPISNSPWVSLIHCVPKKGGITVVENENNELIPTRLVPGNEFYCFLDGFYGYLQIPINPRDQKKTTFTCLYGTFAYQRMPFGLCNAPETFQRCMMVIFHDMIEKTMKVFDELIKSSVEDLIPIPSEFEGIPNTMCDVHPVKNSTPLEAKDHLEIVINSKDDNSSSDDDSLYNENIEYVEASPHDSELVSLEAAE
nr:reverse transcriptase domain-containing protein [Tanacetum cinerariifolium]